MALKKSDFLVCQECGMGGERGRFEEAEGPTCKQCTRVYCLEWSLNDALRRLETVTKTDIGRSAGTPECSGRKQKIGGEGSGSGGWERQDQEQEHGKLRERVSREEGAETRKGSDQQKEGQGTVGWRFACEACWEEFGAAVCGTKSSV